jgi:hypothetical protein
MDYLFISLSLSLSLARTNTFFSFASFPISTVAISPLSLVAIRVNKARKMLPGQITKECKGKKKTLSEQEGSGQQTNILHLEVKNRFF